MVMDEMDDMQWFMEWMLGWRRWVSRVRGQSHTTHPPTKVRLSRIMEGAMIYIVQKYMMNWLLEKG